MSQDRLRYVVASALGLSLEDVGESTAMADCSRWDSLRHFHLILDVEHAFGVRFSSDRIPELTSVLALREEISRLLP